MKTQSLCQAGDRWVEVKKVILEEAISELNPNTTQESARRREEEPAGGTLAGSWENLCPRSGHILHIRAFFFLF